MNKNLLTAIFIMAMGVVVTILSIHLNDADKRNLEAINKKVAPQMAQCWEAAAETGQVCEVEYIYVDGGQTLVSAKAVMK